MAFLMFCLMGFGGLLVGVLVSGLVGEAWVAPKNRLEARPHLAARLAMALVVAIGFGLADWFLMTLLQKLTKGWDVIPIYEPANMLAAGAVGIVLAYLFIRGKIRELRAKRVI